MQLASLFTAAFLAGLVAAAPTPTPVEKRTPTSAADQIAAIMPSSTSCATTNDQCRTNVQAAPRLIDAMSAYNITRAMEIAGILALIGYESLDMQYNTNLNAANAANGQGTSNMQQGKFNVQYAESIPALASQNPTTSNVLSLVTADEYNFGTGPWFYSSQCADVMAAAGTDTADVWWTAYMGCVGADLTETARADYWARAKTAFGLS